MPTPGAGPGVGRSGPQGEQHEHDSGWDSGTSTRTCVASLTTPTSGVRDAGAVVDAVRGATALWRS